MEMLFSINCDCYFQIHACDRCQRYDKMQTQAPVLQPIVVNEALELVGMDLIGPLTTTDSGHKFVLTMIDYFTKFVELFALPDK